MFFKAFGNEYLLHQGRKVSASIAKSSLALALLLLFAASASAQVAVSAPTQGATVAAPVHVAASFTPGGAHAMRIYLDGQSVFLTNSSHLDTFVPASSGSHLLVVQAWDSTGKVFKNVNTVKVASAPPPPPPPGVVFDNVHQWTGWLTCGACGNSGGGGSLATYDMIRGITTPSLTGSSSHFTISSTHPYSNGYWYYRQQPQDKAIKALVYEFDIFVPAGSENAPQAIEFECQQRLNGYVYNFAWQANYAGNSWRIFNYAARKWEDSGVALQRFSPNTWHHVVAEYHNDPNTHTVFHDAISVDGVRHVVNKTHAAKQTSNQTNEFTNAFQLDINGRMTPYSVFIDKMNVTITE